MKMEKIFMVLFKKAMPRSVLHVDAGFNSKESYIQTEFNSSNPVGSTVIFKNRYYGGSTSFTQMKKN